MSQVRLLCAENGQISIVGQAHSLCCNGAAQSTILLLILTMVNPYSGNSALASVSDHHFGHFTAPFLGLLDLDNFLVFCADEFIPVCLELVLAKAGGLLYVMAWPSQICCMSSSDMRTNSLKCG